MTEQLGFVGLGNMGFEMAQNLQKYLSSQGGKGLIYYNRTIKRGDPIKKLGGTPGTLDEVTEKCSIIFFMLANDQITESTIDKILENPGAKGKLLVDCSTVFPDTSVKLEEKITKAGAQFVSSPLFGLPPVAAAAKLIFIPAGPQELVDRIRPFLVPGMGKSVIYMGREVRKALVMKITGNAFNLGVTELISQVSAFGESQGLTMEEITEWAKQFIGPYGELYFSRNRDGKYLPPAGQKPMMTVPASMKDSNHALNLAKQSGSKLPIIEQFQESLKKAVDLRGENIDISGSYGYYRTLAGLDFENDVVKKRDGKM